MSLLELYNSKLKYKLILPMVAAIVIGLMAVVVYAIWTINQISLEKQHELSKQYESTFYQILTAQSDLLLTNAITLTENNLIQSALARKDARDIQPNIESIIENYRQFSNNKNIHIQLLDINNHPLLHSKQSKPPKPVHNQDRDSLKQIKEQQIPFVSLEIKQNKLLQVALAPIFYKDMFVGTIEVTQDLTIIFQQFQKSFDIEGIILGGIDELEDKQNFQQIGTNRKILFKTKNSQDVITDLSSHTFITSLSKQQFMTKNYFAIQLPLKNHAEQLIAGGLILTEQLVVQNIIKSAREAILYQLAMMFISALLVIIALALFLEKIIAAPIENIANNIRNVSKEIDNIEKLQNYKKTQSKRSDEIGAICNTLDLFVNKTLSLYHDVTHSHKITNEYLKAVYAGSIVSKSDLKGNITYANDEFCEATGYSKEELIGQPHSIFRHPSTPRSTYKEMWQHIQQGRIWNGLFKNKRKDGSTFYAKITVVPIQDEHGEIIEYLALRDDVTELVVSQKKLQQAFQTDVLTSLGNRFKLNNDMEKLANPHLAVLDIRSFKEINDFYGHEQGDLAIIELSKVLFDFFHSRSYEVYRLQADEFAILSDEPTDELENFSLDLIQFVDQLAEKPIAISDDHELNIDLTIGLSFNHGDLLNEAEIAHQTAKKLNQTFVKYTDELTTSEEYKNNLLWANKVKQALNQDRILNFYQPIVNNKTQAFEKFETLVRMEGEDGSIVSPYYFLDISKKARLYPKLTKTIIEKSFIHFAQHQNDSLNFSINLTAEDMVDEQVVAYLTSKIRRHPSVAKRLVIEIVESESIQSFDAVQNFINEMKMFGCKIAVDDFGTGYSNFEFLLKLKPDFIKIDGSMVKNIHNDPDAYNVVETVVEFAKKNNIKTIAEFVSEKAVYDKVRELGIDYSQGFYFGAPEPAANTQPNPVKEN